jgi:regulatory Fis family protein
MRARPCSATAGRAISELQNAVERALTVSEGGLITTAQLGIVPPPTSREAAPAARPDGATSLAVLEQRMVTDALDRACGNKSKAARLLGLTEPSRLSPWLHGAPTASADLQLVALGLGRERWDFPHPGPLEGLTHGLEERHARRDAQRQLFISEIDLARTSRDQLTSVVQLYKALGGGWTPETGATPGR